MEKFGVNMGGRMVLGGKRVVECGNTGHVGTISSLVSY